MSLVNLAPNAAPSATLPYDLQLAKIKRQQEMAQALQEQTSAPIPIQSSGGIQAPIPWTAILAKALQGANAGMRETTADDAMNQIGTQDQATKAALSQTLHQQVPGTVSSATSLDATAPQLPGGPAPTPQTALLDTQRPAMTDMPLDQKLDAILMAPDAGPSTRDYKSAMSALITGKITAQDNAKLQREQALWQANNVPQSLASKQEQQSSLAAQKEMERFKNLEAPTQQQMLEHQDRLAQINKPQFAPYGSTGYFTGQQFHQIPGGGLPGAPGGNPEGKSPQEILGLSGNGYNSLIGNYSGMGPRDKASAQREADTAIIARGLDPSIVRPRVQGLQDTVKTNVIKANVIDYLTAEVKGTIQNFVPIANQIAPNDLRWTNQGAQYIGSALNGDAAQQYAFYMTQLRSELAGSFAAAEGKINNKGKVEADQSHQAMAEKVIKDGINSGGMMGLAKAIEASRIKNVAAVQHQGEEAQRGIWEAVGLGPQYDALHPQQAQAGGGGGGGTPHPQDQQAIAWARANPKDPRSAKILRENGVQ